MPHAVESSQPQLEVLLHGLGAIGSFYAFILSRSPQVRLSVCARSNYDAVKEKGLIINSDNHGAHVVHPAAVLKRPEDAGHKFDFIVVSTKATDMEKTTADLQSVIEEGRTSIVIMQNGVGNEDWFFKRWPQITVLNGVVYVSAAQRVPGIVEHNTTEGTEIGIARNPNLSEEKQQVVLDRFATLLREGGTPFKILPNIETAKWRKCICNAAWNSLSALSAGDVHSWLFSSEFAKDTTRRLMMEAVHVAQAAGIPDIDESLPDSLIKEMQGYAGPMYTSMYWDSKARRAMEVDVIMGAIVKKGKELNVAVPTLETIYALVWALHTRFLAEMKVKQSQAKVQETPASTSITPAA